MKTQLQNKMATLLLTTISMTTMIACSSQSSNSPVYTGTGATTTTATPNINQSGQAVTNCSKDVANIADLSMNLQLYTTGSTYNTNVIRVKFNAFPAEFSNSNSTIIFWAYGTDSLGNYTGATQVPFSVEKYSGGTFTSISGSKWSMTWQQLATLAASQSVDSSSAASALQGITFVVNLGSIPAATILNASLYLNGPGTGSTKVDPDRYLQALIPAFLANPNQYYLSHNNTLTSLHPFASYGSSNYSEVQYSSLGTSLCF